MGLAFKKEVRATRLKNFKKEYLSLPKDHSGEMNGPSIMRDLFVDVSIAWSLSGLLHGTRGLHTILPRCPQRLRNAKLANRISPSDPKRPQFARMESILACRTFMCVCFFPSSQFFALCQLHFGLNVSYSMRSSQ